MNALRVLTGMRSTRGRGLYLILLMLCLLSVTLGACGSSSDSQTESSTEEQTQVEVDETYGRGLSFNYTDYADGVLSLSYSLTKNEEGQWVLSVGGQNAHVSGSRVVFDDAVDTFFLYLVRETNIPSYKDYNEQDDHIKTDVAWWFNLNIYYENDSIVAYGYMMHPSDYDDVRVTLTEYLNSMFKAAGQE